MLKVGVIGYGGRIRDMLKEFLKTGKVERIDMSGDFGQHFGGDRRLAEAFIRVMEGESSPSTLAEGIQSVSMCLAARESAEKKCMVDVDFSVGK